MLDDNELQKLLRLKRYEQPSPEYFDKFLNEFHRRQRAEMLRRSAWRIAWDRVTAFFSEQTVGSFAYAAATALVLIVAGITSLNIVTSHHEAVIAQAQPVSAQPFGLNTRVHLPDFNELSNQTAHSATASLRPRYVMDARPVSYEPTSSF